ncbi:MAG: SirB2 family protein [Arenimonas sp.]|uniref:SirB2 family protein n=1 Tax=Arenimonas sp. TaxID=1872635 RepID=UPI003C0688AD
MIEFYIPVKSVHVAAVLASGSLFALRGVLVLTGRAWAMSAPLRYLSYSIDTVLLTAALMLATMLPGAVFANGWLAVKLTLLVSYVLLGSFALKRGRSNRSRILFFIAAVIVYAFMYSVARTHQPLGVFALFQTGLT